MSEFVTQIQDWQRSARPVSIVRVVATAGFSSRERATLAAFTAGEPLAGSVLSGALDGQLAARLEADGRLRTLLDLRVTDEAAADAGLSCGGSARLLVQPALDIDPVGWAELGRGAPVCVITALTRAPESRARAADELPAVGRTEVFSADRVDEAEARYGPGVRRIFNRGTSQTAVLETETAVSVVSSLWPVPRLVIVGGGLIAHALVDAAGLLEWSARIVESADEAGEAIAAFTHADAVVVLSHDRAVDGPVLRAALAGQAGYVGGLGSAHTQRQRADWLAAAGVAAEEVARIHGPAGLDIGAFTPAEIATSITAEIVAVRSGAGGTSLQGRTGPIRS